MYFKIILTKIIWNCKRKI